MKVTLKDYIVLPKTAHGPLGYLSNDSAFGFTYNDVYWPTVTHYIEGQKFRGTQYENIIRNAKTPSQAKRKALYRDMLTLDSDTIIDTDYIRKSKEKVYGNRDDKVIINALWHKERKTTVTTAIIEKFKAHPKLYKALAMTHPKIIIPHPSTTINGGNASTYKIDSLTADTLMKIRADYICKYPNNVKTSMNFANNSVALLCDDIRLVVLILSKYICKMEYLRTVYPEMVDDAIVNIKSTRFTSEKLLQIYATKIKVQNTTRNVEKKICGKKSEKYIPKIAKKVCKFTTWASQDEVTLTKIHQYIHPFLIAIHKCFNLSGTQGSTTILKNRLWNKRTMKLLWLEFDKMPIKIPYGSRWYRANRAELFSE